MTTEELLRDLKLAQTDLDTDDLDTTTLPVEALRDLLAESASTIERLQAENAKLRPDSAW